MGRRQIQFLFATGSRSRSEALYPSRTDAHGHQVDTTARLGAADAGQLRVRSQSPRARFTFSPFRYGELSDWYADEFSLYLTLNDISVVFQTSRVRMTFR